MPKVHRVRAALAVVTDGAGHGHYLYQGSLVPPGLAPAAELKRLTELQLLEPIELAVPDDAPPPGDQTGANDAGTPPSGTTTPPTGTPPAGKRPANTASKAVWVDYAVSRGMTREEASELSRDDLADRYPAA